MRAPVRSESKCGSYLRLLDAEEPQLRRTAGQDHQRGLGHGRLVQAELGEAGRRRMEVQHHPSVRHFGLVQRQEAQAL